MPPHAWAWLGALLGLVAAAALLVQGRRLARLRRQGATREARLRELQQQHDALARAGEQHARLEADLLRAKREAEAAVLAKSEFLATMSHEIRTPLNGIIPMLEMIGDGPLAEAQRQMLATADTSSRQLLRIVDDILDHSRLEAHALQLERTPFNLRELLEGVLQLMRHAAAGKGLQLLLELDPAVRLAVQGDPVRLRQVLGNLVGNAIKFTARGEVRICVRRMGETDSSHLLRFEVIDTGIGIDPGERERLFQAFSQADASTTRVYGGTGLGLAICRRIVALMQGRIDVSSEPGRGATFWFEIPLERAPGDAPARPRWRRVLLLGGSPALRQRLERVAGQHDLQVVHADAVDHAQTLLRLPAPPGVPPLAWMIVDTLALEDGPGVLQNAILAHRQRAPLEVLWLHAGDGPSSAGQHWRERLQNDAELHALFAPPLSSSRPPALLQATRHAAAPAPRPALALRVLLAEDNLVNMQVAQYVLQAMGCTVRCVPDGAQALAALHEGDIDIVLMDCQMPVMDGYEATRRWRAATAGDGRPRLPILAMTANAMAGDRERCLQAGMDGYLSKPIDPATLYRELVRWSVPGATVDAVTETGATMQTGIGNALEEASSGQASASGGTFAACPGPTGMAARGTDQPATPVLDDAVLQELHDVIGNNVHGIIEAFRHDAPVALRKLQQAAAIGRMETLAALAHSLKSSSANLGLMALAAAAARIERGARDATLHAPVPAVEALAQAHAQACTALGAWRPGTG